MAVILISFASFASGSAHTRTRPQHGMVLPRLLFVPALFYPGPMYDARAVSNFFFHRAAEVGSGLTIMTLLKVLYFAHAWHLAKTGNPLIAQPFEAWQHGPVNRVVYEQYKGYGRRPIDKPAVSYDPIKLEFVETKVDFDASTVAFLSNIFDYYSRFDPFKLSDLTHDEGGPWHIIWTEAQNKAVPGMVIPNQLIEKWFQSHRNALMS